MMTSGLIWILFICYKIHNASSENPEKQLLALKQDLAEQPDCTPTFEIRHPGYITPNGTAHPGITTEEECKSACINALSCMSYQIDSRPGEPYCRLQSSYSIDDLPQSLYSGEVKEYVYTVKCINATSKGECAPLIEVRLRNWNSHLGREQLTVKSALECRAMCFDDQDCMTYHIDHIPGHPLCYIQKDLEMFQKGLLYMGNELNQVMEFFVVDRCFDKYVIPSNRECSPAFKKSHNKVSKCAKPYLTVTTEQLCRLTCLFTSDCMSYQIDRRQENPFCLIQTNKIIDCLKAAQTDSSDLITEYVLVDSCSDQPLDNTGPDCKPYIVKKPYPGGSDGAVEHKEVSSYENCELLCLNTPSCAAFLMSDGSCWIQKDWENLMPKHGYPSADKTEYVVIRKCAKGGNSTESPPMSSIAGSTESSPASSTVGSTESSPGSSTVGSTESSPGSSTVGSTESSPGSSTVGSTESSPGSSTVGSTESSPGSSTVGSSESSPGSSTVGSTESSPGSSTVGSTDSSPGSSTVGSTESPPGSSTVTPVTPSDDSSPESSTDEEDEEDKED